MNPSAPFISVIMPVYNCEAYIKESLESILNQSFTDFEFLIIDDASTDKTVNRIRSYNDSRIRLFQKPMNTGYSNSLNMGLKLAKGKYVARMDGDDISLPERFAKQVAFLEANPNVILCGTAYRIIGTSKIKTFPIRHEEIKVQSILGCSIAHPTVMIRNIILQKYKLGYNPEMEPSEDYDLWTRMLFLGNLANLNEVQLLYRVHDTQTSIVRTKQQKKASQIIRTRMIEKLIPDIPRELPLFELSAGSENSKILSKELKERFRYMDKLIAANRIKYIYESKLFLTFIKTRKGMLVKSFIENSNAHSILALFIMIFYLPAFFLYVGYRKRITSSLKYFKRYLLGTKAKRQ